MISAAFLCGFQVSKLIKYCFYGTLHKLPLSSFVQDHANQKQKKIMTTLWRPLLLLKVLNHMTIPLQLGEKSSHISW